MVQQPEMADEGDDAEGAVEVQLRHVGDDDVELVERMFSDPGAAGPYNWFGRPPPGSVQHRVREVRAGRSTGGLQVVALGNGTAVGVVTWHPVSHGPGSTCWNVGISLLPAYRGRGIGSAAQQLLATYLFAVTPVQRVEASTDVDNVAEQRALERAGFRSEGVLRRAQQRAGGWHDIVLYSRLRGE